MQDFKQLEVWHKAYRLALSLYEVTRAFPKGEMYGLTGQMRRAAISIPANIAEGCGRGSNAELIRFLHIAMGSASELECQLMLSRDLELIENEVYDQINHNLVEVKRMLTGLTKLSNQ